MKIINTCLCFTLCIFSLQLWASNIGTIEAMQMPAWIKHSNGEKKALKPGMIIQSGDQIQTGQTSRLLIHLNEGGHLKLGENTQLDFSHQQTAQKKPGIFTLNLTVIRGALRFTNRSAKKNKTDIKIKLGVVTASIKGTDIWGHSNTKEDLLCLIAGHISAQRDGEPEFTMRRPLSYYLVPHDKPAEAVQTVPQNILAHWAAQTELLDGGGVLTVKGKWHVNLMSLSSLKTTEPVIKLFSKAGYAAEVQPFISLGRNWYRIRVTGFKTREDAKIFTTIIDGMHGVRRPWISKS